MSGNVRMVVVPASSHMDGLADLVRSHERRVLLVCVTRPYASLKAGLEERGVDVDEAAFLDAITCLNGAMPPAADPRVRFVRSPTMLEMIAMRTEQMALQEDATVIVDSLNALTIYNGIVPVQEFSHFLANRLRQSGGDIDFVVADTDDGRRMTTLLATVVDETIHHGPMEELQ